MSDLCKLLSLFHEKEEIEGTNLVREMWLTDEDDINNFFLKYVYEKRVLEPNPGCEVMSSIWIENSYGLRPEWRRQKRLIELGI